ncbi:RING-H2 finger protein ATL38-like [Arachis stenosperma]|uniref:RING-H2 finger protein ATL38-like n=1 Tax=Arachis stenosperma TaxID=217475 RepID=UPI0025ABF90B|nr:RING-H2 finger protein ATL38-like [Arachis stenosperma]
MTDLIECHPPSRYHQTIHHRVLCLSLFKLSLHVIVTNNLFVQDGGSYPPHFLFLFLLIFHTPLATAQQQEYPLPKVRGDKTMVIVLLVLVAVFFALGLLSIYIRQCSERRHRDQLHPAILSATYGGGNSGGQHHGLDIAVVDSFPTFIYSNVKSHKIGQGALECAVCLCEFQDEETLRLIPQCCHVFHSDCIDVWFSSHSTCPVCRANLTPKPPDTSSPQSLVVNISDQPDTNPVNSEPNIISLINDGDQNNAIITEPKSHQEMRTIFNFDEENGSVRSFYRFNSAGHFTVRPVENFERFTLRLPEDMRDRLVNVSSVNRTVSCRVTFQRERSQKEGYRTRSARSTEPPFIGMTRFERLEKGESIKGNEVEVDGGERSFDLLFPKGSRDEN